MAFTRYEPDASGGIRFHDDAGGSFVSFGAPAQAQAMQLDAAAAAAGTGAMQPTDYYAGLGMPGAAPSGDGRAAVEGALFGPNRTGGTTQPVLPAMPAAGPVGEPATASPISGQPSVAPGLGGGSNGFGTGYSAQAAPTFQLSPEFQGRVGDVRAAALATPGGDAGKVALALGATPSDGPQFLPGPDPRLGGAMALKMNKGAVDPTTSSFQSFGGPDPRPSAVTTGRLGTGNPALDAYNARLMQPGRLVATKGGMQPFSLTTKRDATPDVETSQRVGVAVEEDAQVKAEGAMKRAEGEQKQADVLASLVPEEQARIAKTTENIEAFRRRTSKAIDDVDADRRSLAEAKVDPSNYFSSMSTGQQIMQMIAIFAGALGGAVTGDNSNVGLDMMNKAVERDIQAQRDNIEQGNRNLSASERRVKLEAEQLGSMEMALDLQRARAYSAAQAKAKQLEAEAKSDAERQKAREFISETQVKLNEYGAKLNAARNGEQVYVQRYQAPSVSQVGGATMQQLAEGAKLNIDAQKAGAQAAKDRRESAPQTLVYGGKRIALRPEINATEGAKYRTAAGGLYALSQQIKRIDEIRSRAIIDPDAKGELEGLIESAGAEWSNAKSQGVVTNQQAERLDSALSSFWKGKGGGKALVKSVETTVDGIVRQAGEGYINEDGSVQPFSQ
jgi:hypothetical protein